MALLKLINWLLTFIRILWLSVEIRAFKEITQTRIGELLQILKHRKKLKIRGKAVFFKRTSRSCFEIEGGPSYECLSVRFREFCEKIKKKAGLIYVFSSFDFQTFPTVLIFFVLAL